MTADGSPARRSDFEDFLTNVRVRAADALTKRICKWDEDADPADVHEDVREDLWPFFEEVRLCVEGPKCGRCIQIAPNIWDNMTATPTPAMYEERIRLLRELLAKAVRLERWVSIGGINSHARLSPIRREVWDEVVAALAEPTMPPPLGEQSLRTLKAAFADALLALDEIDQQEIAERLRQRWPEAVPPHGT